MPANLENSAKATGLENIGLHSNPKERRCQKNAQVQFSSVQSLSRVRLSATPLIAARQASLSISNSRSSLRLMSIELWCHPAISSPVVLFSSCPQTLPASESFPISQLFAWGGQSTGVRIWINWTQILSLWLTKFRTLGMWTTSQNFSFITKIMELICFTPRAVWKLNE